MRKQRLFPTQCIALLLPLMMLIILTSGCAHTNDSIPAVSSVSTPTLSPGADHDSIDMTPSTTLTNQHSTQWNTYQVVTSKTLRLFYSAGDTGCYGYRTVAKQDSSQVRIRIIEGTLPNAPDTCTLIGMYGSILVHLEQPLGSRTLLAEQ